MTTSTLSEPRTRTTTPSARWLPLTGIGFVVLFVLSVVASNPPANNASNAKWIADYTGTSHKASHIITGVCLVLAGLCLVSFMTSVWQRVRLVSDSQHLSPLPVVAAGVAAACMGVGGVLMGGVASIVRSGSAPTADVLRLGNNLGFAMVGLGGMLATALCIAVLTTQARAAGLFGRKLSILGYVVAVLLLASILFAPIVALLVWLVVVSVAMTRGSAGRVG